MEYLDAENGEKVASAIEKRIQQIARYVYKDSPYNKIKFGVIKEISGKAYTIEIENTIYTDIYALKNIGTINLGDKVVCVNPNNNYSNLFILGILDED